jgi:hypothetical protein
VGFRLPREQLLALRALPLAPDARATALLAVPVLAVLLLQTLAVLALALSAGLHPGLAAAALVAFAATNTTVTAVESWFVLKRPHPNSINLAHSVAQVLLQVAALLPGLLVLVLLSALTGARPAALLLGALTQGLAAWALARRLGRRLQVGEVAVP